jgi:hypothetical protein
MSVALDAGVAEPEVLPLRLLRDERSVDAAVGDVAGASAMIGQLSAIVVAGFAAHALTVAATAWPSLGPWAALRLGGAWWIASTVGFFAAICAGLPSYWFYGVVARIEAPAWRLAVELVRVQAVGAVVLVGVLPFWLVVALGMHLLGEDVYRNALWMGYTYSLPFQASLPGLLGLIRVFLRMRDAVGETGWLPPLGLAACWVVLFLYTAPMAIWSLFNALG